MLRTSELLVSDSPRLSGEDPEHIRLLAESDDELPPIIVHRPTMRVIDGVHRLRAAVRGGREEIEAHLFDGDDNAAFVLAVKANSTHGMPLSLADRKVAANRILRSYPYWSDRMIAEVVGLSPKTVGAARNCSAQDVPRLDGRIGKDGKTRPVDSTRGREAAGDFLAAHPEASVQAIARAAGVSRSTARDVRDRWRNGMPVVPAGRQEMPETPDDDPGPTTADVSPLSASVTGLNILRALQRDPSLRHTDSGRMLLRLLDATIRGHGDWNRIAEQVPQYCTHVVAAAARECSNAWRNLADRLEQQRGRA